MAYIGPTWNIPLWAARASARTGWTATEALARFRAAGGHIRDSTFYDVWREASEIARAEPQEVAANLGRVPTLGEVQTIISRRERGFIHEAEVLLRQVKQTEHGFEIGEIKTANVNVHTDKLLTRREVTQEAIRIAQAHQAEYGDVVIGAIHTGAYLVVGE